MRKVARVTIAFVANAVIVACVVIWYTSRETMPAEIRIATGKKGGLYDELAQEIGARLQERTGRPVRVIETAGTEENVALLRAGGAELALTDRRQLSFPISDN